MTVNNLVADFQRLLEESQAAGTESELFLQVMEPEAAKQFRLCAIPHQFDPKILRVLVPDLDADQARRRCEEFVRLSAVTPTGETWAVHDKWRRDIFTLWLRPDNYPEFQIASQRLADFFDAQANSQSGTVQEAMVRRRMYHLLGADQAAGFSEFERLFQCARRQLRLAECATLIKLAHDYDAVLIPENVARLSYHEGKLASDQHDWKKAEHLLAGLSRRSDIEPKLRAKAFRRLGYVFAEQGNYPAAFGCQQNALKIALANPEANETLPSILHELGVEYRDYGDYAEAEKILKESGERAAMQQNRGWVAIASNSLGHLYLKQHQARQAIASFRSALENLEETQDALQISLIYNNLGLAYAEFGKWQTSQDWYTKSLEITRRSGDVAGQASALNNLSRVSANLGHLDKAIEITTEAVVLFERAGEPNKAAICKQNLGKYYRKLGKKDLARQSLGEAIDLFVKMKNGSGEESARTDLKNIDTRTGLPWWALLSCCLGGLAFLLLILVIIGWKIF